MRKPCSSAMAGPSNASTNSLSPPGRTRARSRSLLLEPLAAPTRQSRQPWPARCGRPTQAFPSLAEGREATAPDTEHVVAVVYPPRRGSGSSGDRIAGRNRLSRPLKNSPRSRARSTLATRRARRPPAIATLRLSIPTPHASIADCHAETPDPSAMTSAAQAIALGAAKRHRKQPKSRLCEKPTSEAYGTSR